MTTVNIVKKQQMVEAYASWLPFKFCPVVIFVCLVYWHCKKINTFKVGK